MPPYFDGINWVPAHYENVPYLNGIRVTGNLGAVTTVWSCHVKYVTTCYPARAAIPGNPGTPPTPSQIITSQNHGWNSYARAIDPLVVDAILNFTVAAGVRGVFVGLGGAGLDGQPLLVFDHGLMIDASGVHVFERGVQGTQLAASYTSLTALQIERRFDGAIVYRADTAEYVSAIPGGSGTLYPYSYMYSGGDRILCASYTAGSGALLSLEADLAALTSTLGESSVNYAFLDADLAALTCAMDCAEVEVIGLSATMPALQAVLGEHGVSYAFIQADLPAVDVALAEAAYIPPALTEIYANLPPLAGFMFCTTVEMCDIDASLPAFEAAMGEGDYAFINVSLPAMGCYMGEGERLDMWMVSGMFGLSPMDMARDLVITIMSGGSLVSMQSMDLIMLQAYMSDIQASSIQEMLGTYGLEYLSDLSVQSVQLMTLPTGAALNGLGRVWVVNLDTNAASQYDGYAFNSFFTRDGRHYGVAEDGIYLLEGDDDAGAPIQALAELGLSNFGTSRAKLVPSLYLGVASTGAMVVKAVADGQAYYYTARSSSTDLKNHRVDTGRGLKGVNWSFTVLNQNGGDFDLASIEFVPLETKRRI